MRVSFKKNAWHARLQRWVFGEVQLRPNLCPYFWLTVFCIIVSPIVGLWSALRLAFSGIVGLIARFVNWIDKTVTASKARDLSDQVMTLGVNGMYRIWRCLDEFDSLYDVSYDRYTTHFLFGNEWLRSRYRKLLSMFQESNPDWEQQFRARSTELAEMWESWRQEQLVLAERRRERQLRRERLLNRVAVVTKDVFTLIGHAAATVLVCAGATLVGLIIFLFIVNFMDIPWLTVGLVLVGLVVASFLIVAGVELVKAVYRRAERTRGPSEPGLVLTYLRAAKENYCPGIDWVD